MHENESAGQAGTWRGADLASTDDARKDSPKLANVQAVPRPISIGDAARSALSEIGHRAITYHRRRAARLTGSAARAALAEAHAIELSMFDADVLDNARAA
jgi:hypothetical protein